MKSAASRVAQARSTLRSGLSSAAATACLPHKRGRPGLLPLLCLFLRAMAEALGGLWWTGLDSNQRTLTRADLQSAAFNHSATCPRVSLSRRAKWRARVPAVNAGAGSGSCASKRAGSMQQAQVATSLCSVGSVNKTCPGSLAYCGAGEGNRTLVVSLEGFCSTIELHPLAERAAFAIARALGGSTAERLRAQLIESLPKPGRRSTMAARPSWRGTDPARAGLRFRSRSIPATKSGAGVAFKQIHEPSGHPSNMKRSPPGSALSTRRDHEGLRERGSAESGSERTRSTG